MVGVGIFILHLKLRGVDPVFSDPLIQILPEAHRLRRPCLVRLGIPVDPVSHHHLLGHQVGINILHIGFLVFTQGGHGSRILVQQLRPDPGKGLLPGLTVLGVDGFFHLGRLRGRKRVHVQHIVVDQLEVHILHRNGDIGALFVICLLQIPVHQLVGDDTGQLLLQKIIDPDLEIPVDGQIHVVSGLGIGLLHDLHDPSRAVHIHGLGALFPLELRLHGGLDAGLSHQIRQLIIGIGLLELFQLIIPYLSCVADDGRKVNAVIVDTEGGLLDGHALKIRRVFQNVGHGLPAHVGGDGGGHIFLVGRKAHGITDIDDPQSLLVRKRHRISVLIRQLIQPIVLKFGVEHLPGSDIRGRAPVLCIQLRGGF